MLANKLFFCFAAALCIFTGANSFYVPSDGVRLTCSEVCHGYIRGKTYSCDMHSPKGMVTTIVRMATDLNWKFYVIKRIQPESSFCQRVAAADEYFVNGRVGCSSHGLRSNSDEADKIDSSAMQSSLRLEDIKRLLKEINNDSTQVLKDLNTTSGKKGLRSQQPTLSYPMKIEIKLVLEKMVDHLFDVGLLNDEVKYHAGNVNSDGYPAPPNHLIRPIHPVLPTHPVQPNHPVRPNIPNVPTYPNRPNRHFSSPSQKYRGYNMPVNSHNFTFHQSNLKDIISHDDFNVAYSAKNHYSHDVKFTTNNLYNVNSQNDKYSTYNDDRNWGTKQRHKAYGKRGEAIPKADEVKELASKLKEESSELLKELENGSLSENLEKKKKLFGSLVVHLSGFMGLIDHVKLNQSSISLTAHGKGIETSQNSTSDANDSSQSVEEHPPLEEKPDSGSKKRKFTHDTSDEHGDCPLCTMILKDICNDGKIVVCNERKCCWRDYNPYHCMTLMNDNRSVTCYNSLFSIIQSANI